MDGDAEGGKLEASQAGRYGLLPSAGTGATQYACCPLCPQDRA
ncbi:hypothetical protein J2S75_001345 [Ancylobacter polymorphus]|uniref:Uncharacterized protein n=1 Tax=Ancylobacter polymorphus TaxID=223390 RepID=A0ABU0B915_9HYPH|nr:hypothetical protein [Ancylobacter polymorphus]